METKKKSNHNQPFNCSSQSTQRINLHMPGELQVASHHSWWNSGYHVGGHQYWGREDTPDPGSVQWSKTWKFKVLESQPFLWNTFCETPQCGANAFLLRDLGHGWVVFLNVPLDSDWMTCGRETALLSGKNICCCCIKHIDICSSAFMVLLLTIKKL